MNPVPPDESVRRNGRNQRGELLTIASGEAPAVEVNMKIKIQISPLTDKEIAKLCDLYDLAFEKFCLLNIKDISLFHAPDYLGDALRNEYIELVHRVIDS